MSEIQLPPHSIESEQSVLGGLMIKSDAWDEIADVITEQDFYRMEHRLIFRHIQRLIERKEPVDILTVSDSIQSTGKLDRFEGGIAYLGLLIQNTPSASNIKHYAKIVHNRRKERDFQSATYSLIEISKNNADIDGKIEQAIEILNSLADDKKNAPVKLTEATAKAIESLERRYASGEEIHGLKTGLIDFDRKTGGLHNGDLIIVAGRPSMGKTSLVTNIAENVSIDYKLPVLFFSLEMSEEQLATRSIANQGSINLNTLRSAKVEDDDWHRLSTALGRIHEAPLFIDSNPMTTATQMFARARKIKRQHGLSLIVIDYLQLMSEDGDNRNNELSAITRKLKLMAKDLNVPVICLSQLSRKVEERGDKRPINSDLRDSGAIEQDADMIVMMYRDEYYNSDSQNKGIAEAIITKQRMGPLGTVLLTFQGEYSRFDNFSGEYKKPEIRNTRRGFDVDNKSRSAGN